MLWILGIASACAGIGVLISHRLSELEVIPVTDPQLGEIAGEDLVWRPSPASKPTFDLAIFDTPAVRTHPYVGSTDADVIKHARDIDGTRPVTDQIEREIRGKVPAPALVSKEGSRLIGVGGQIVRLYVNQARLCLVRKDTVGAVDRIKKAAEAVQIGNEYQSGVLVSGSAFNSMIRSILATHLLSAPQLRSIFANLPPAPPTDNKLHESLNYEYQCMALLMRSVTSQSIEKDLQPSPIDTSPTSTTVDLLSSGPDEPPLGQFDGAATMREIAALYREAKRNSLLPWSKQTWPAAAAYAESVRQIPEQPHIDDNDSNLAKWWIKTRYRWSMGKVRNVLGLTAMYQILADDGPKLFVDESFRYRTQCEATRLLIAIEIYQKTFAKYPASLADLKSLKLSGPDCVDLFLGGPFHYDPGARLLWSVGPNAKDDGGRFVRGGPADDMRFVVP